MIDISNLSFQYQGKEFLFKNLNLQLTPGRIYGLLGKNGVGKTTLLRIIAGLLFPKNGDCCVFNFKPSERQPHFLQEIFFISEEFYLPSITAQKYVDLYAPFYPRFKKDNFLTNLQIFDLSLEKNLNDHSYGQKKKFLLSFALATGCKILIFDEPSNGLDIPSKSIFRKLVACALSEDKTFIIATHQVRDLENLIDTVLILDNAKMIFHRTIEDIAKRLAFTMVPNNELESKHAALFEEKILSGYLAIQENTEEAESLVNLELLFNAVISAPEKINSAFIFRSDKHDHK